MTVADRARSPKWPLNMIEMVDSAMLRRFWSMIGCGGTSGHRSTMVGQRESHPPTHPGHLDREARGMILTSKQSSP